MKEKDPSLDHNIKKGLIDAFIDLEKEVKKSSSLLHDTSDCLPFVAAYIPEFANFPNSL